MKIILLIFINILFQINIYASEYNPMGGIIDHYEKGYGTRQIFIHCQSEDRGICQKALIVSCIGYGDFYEKCEPINDSVFLNPIQLFKNRKAIRKATSDSFVQPEPFEATNGLMESGLYLLVPVSLAYDIPMFPLVILARPIHSILKPRILRRALRFMIEEKGKTKKVGSGKFDDIYDSLKFLKNG